MTNLFLDATLRVLQVHYWTAHQGQSFSEVLTPHTPLSDVLPRIWGHFNTSAHEALHQTEALYLLSGPGSLTSLRVLFAYVQGLWVTHPDLKVFMMPTPAWIAKVCELCLHQQYQYFLFQVGRYAFVTGKCDDISTYRALHVKEISELTPILERGDLITQTRFSVSSYKGCMQLDALSLLPRWIEQTFEAFKPLSSLKELKPIQLM